MSDSPKPPVLWSIIIMRWAMGVLLLVALAFALWPGLLKWWKKTPTPGTSGDAADIRLVGVAPDGDEVLYDAAGKLMPGATLEWPGERTYTWSPSMMQRDFLFELGRGAENVQFVPNNSAGVQAPGRRGWPASHSLGAMDERARTPEGRERALLRMTVSTNYYQRGFLGRGNQAPLETVDLFLYFHAGPRGNAMMTFKGPFALGQTNAPENNMNSRLTVLPPSGTGGGGGAGRLQAWDTQMGYYSQAVLFYDQAGRRYAARQASMISGGMGYTNQYELPPFPLTNLAYVTVGENARVKTFHNVTVNYPGRPPLDHSPVLDRLAAALGRTNVAATSLANTSPRSFTEAVTMLEFLPAHQSAMSYLAHAGRTTNFAELSLDEREKLRARARAWADGAEAHRRDMGLRVGLRGGWPEFVALGITRLREGGEQDKSSAAAGFAANPKLLGAENIPLVLALARSNAAPALAAQLVGLLGSFGRAADEALLELTRADEPWLWWNAIGYLPVERLGPAERLGPVEGWSGELQQRVWMVRDSKKAFITPENEAAARVRLAAMLTPEMCARAFGVFGTAAQRAGVLLERGAAMEAYAKYLRAAGNEQLRYHNPIGIIQRVNGWYGKDFGGLGDGKKGGRYPSSEEYPGIVEDVLEFYDKLKREGKVETGK